VTAPRDVLDDLVLLPSGDGRAQHLRANHIQWPITVPLLELRRAHLAPSSEPLSIDCALHGRSHRLAIRLTERNVAALAALLASARPDMTHTLTVTLSGPEDIGPAAHRDLLPTFLDIARLLAEVPADRPAPSHLLGSPSVCRAVGLAAALLHARDCVTAHAATETVSREVKRSRRPAAALRGLPETLSIRAETLLNAHWGTAVTVHVEIDCAYHARRHAIGSAHPLDVAGLVHHIGHLRRRAVTFRRDEDGRPRAAILSLLLEAAREMASLPDSPQEEHRHLPAPALALAAAATHARDCLHADAIIRAVTAEIRATGRVAYALRSAADPAWVALRALETA
jgi:hypothetical protein